MAETTMISDLGLINSEQNFLKLPAMQRTSFEQLSLCFAFTFYMIDMPLHLIMYAHGDSPMQITFSPTACHKHGLLLHNNLINSFPQKLPSLIRMKLRSINEAQILTTFTSVHALLHPEI